jgi:hypothetical protein
MKEKFHGQWELVSYELRSASDEFYAFPYSKNAKGLLWYGSNSQMTALLMNPERRNFEKAHSWRGTADEYKESFRGYTSYAGHFELAENEVVHHVEMSLFPNWIGTRLRRYFEFKDRNRKLLLTTDFFETKSGQKVRHVLLWERQS